MSSECKECGLLQAKLALATEALEQYKWWPMGTPVNCKIAHEALAKLKGRYISPDDAQFMSDMNKKSPDTTAPWSRVLLQLAPGGPRCWFCN